MNEESPLQQLEKLSNFLHGAHLVCDHENSSSTFHIAKHTLDEIIVQIKLNNKPYWVPYAEPKV